jgi:hypothetical protein
LASVPTMTLKKTWRKLTPRESSKLERGDTVAVRLDRSKILALA